jgi:GT2 family glycosyltransferase
VPSSSVRVSFVVVNWNGGEMLKDCLTSLSAQTLTDFEVIIVDNGSTDGSCDGLEGLVQNLSVLRAGANLGFAEANNRAFTQAKGEFIAMVNNDATLDPKWTEHLVLALEKAPRAGAAAGRTVQTRTPERIDSAGFEFYSCASASTWRDASTEAFETGPHAPFGPAASAALYRRSALEEVGVFHPEYFCYYEDVDLAVRLVLWGYETAWEPRALASHLGSQTGKERSTFHCYHLRRNVEFLYWVDMVGALAWLNLPFHLAYEVMSLGAAAGEGQMRTALKAKRDAFRQRGWILEERHELRTRLEERGRLRSAQANLLRRSRLGFPLLARLTDLTRRAGLRG